ncbi:MULTISPECIES: transglycosylase SLT domain-containing protein [Alkalimonas]|uniref:Transglycosylase SLT domain-containing protein n=1 Tax=Alkalimonas mucilaginosa TaxID=3057676 RepID=A0ABU7JAW8_9GAMM|nr:hypothetical protein [Alkalimonas sp. MEB004]MEE2022640.1 hypothetical protein [Alkalimonas sp. MEB004]
MKTNNFLIGGVFFSVVLLSGCSTPPPQNSSNICDIFKEHRSWYKAAANTRDKWGVPIHVPMSMMFQESSFRHNARPPMRYFLGFIPYGRASSAYGYSQAKTETWADYQRETNRRFASRSNFSDAMDFMGWYIDKTHRINGVSKWDAYNQYLNYHDGWGGFQRGTYRNKTWLISVARRVDDRAQMYATQLSSCEKELQRGWFRRLIGF